MDSLYNVIIFSYMALNERTVYVIIRRQEVMVGTFAAKVYCERFSCFIIISEVRKRQVINGLFTQLNGVYVDSSSIRWNRRILFFRIIKLPHSHSV